jgi:predicted Zn-dependent peptidase
VKQHALPNGLVLVAETIPTVRTVGFTFLLPAGAAFELAEAGGTATMVAEWVMRGAGDRDGSALLQTLDNLGVSHGETAQTVHTSFAGLAMARNLTPMLAVYADILLRARLDEDEIEPIRAQALQAIAGLDADPATKVIYELRRRHFPDPWGRPAIGDAAGASTVTPEALRAFYTRQYRPNGAILGVAGAVDWPVLRDTVDRLFEDWKPGPEPLVRERATGPHRDHLRHEAQQVQIALAYPAATVASPDYYRARATAAILGGYASARLFTEVREKRGLCYSVYASYESQRDRAAILCYAGTSADRAQETLDVTLAELARLARSGVEPEELETMRAGLKSSLIMQQEASMSRSGALASDWFFLRRVRTLAEIGAGLDALTPASVGAYAVSQPLDAMTIVTMGPRPLKLPG